MNRFEHVRIDERTNMHPQESTSCKVIVTGDYGHRDFAVMHRAAPGDVSFQSFERVTTMSTAPDLIAVAQARRGQFSQAEINHLRTRFPLVPIVIVLGSLCEGETLSGQPQKGVHRVYWHKWPFAFEKFCWQTAQNGLSDWHQPVTVSRADRLLNENSELTQLTVPNGTNPSMIVSSADRSGFELVCDVCTPLGWQISWIEADQAAITKPSVVLVINALYELEMVGSRATQIRQRMGDIPVIVLAGFSRYQDVELLSKSLPSCKVVSKPFDNAELVHAICASLANLDSATFLPSRQLA